jgi:hypothetical protein
MATMASSSGHPDGNAHVQAGGTLVNTGDIIEQAGMSAEQIGTTSVQAGTAPLRTETTTIQAAPAPVQVMVTPGQVTATPSQAAITQTNPELTPPDTDMETPEHTEITLEQAEDAVRSADAFATHAEAYYKAMQKEADKANTLIAHAFEQVDTAMALLVAARVDAAQEVDTNPEDNPAVRSARTRVEEAEKAVRTLRGSADVAHIKRDIALVETARADAHLAKVQKTAALVRCCVANSRYQNLLQEIPIREIRSRAGSFGEVDPISFSASASHTQRSQSWQAGVNRGVVFFDRNKPRPGTPRGEQRGNQGGSQQHDNQAGGEEHANQGGGEEHGNQGGEEAGNQGGEEQRDTRRAPMRKVFKFFEHLKLPKKRGSGPPSQRTRQSPTGRDVVLPIGDAEPRARVVEQRRRSSVTKVMDRVRSVVTLIKPGVRH